jgi:hypothetical protein
MKVAFDSLAAIITLHAGNFDTFGVDELKEYESEITNLKTLPPATYIEAEIDKWKQTAAGVQRAQATLKTLGSNTISELTTAMASFSNIWQMFTAEFVAATTLIQSGAGQSETIAYSFLQNANTVYVTLAGGLNAVSSLLPTVMVRPYLRCYIAATQYNTSILAPQS